MYELQRIQESSQYLATLLRGRPAHSDWLFSERNLWRRYALTELYQDLHRTTASVAGFSELLTAFRHFKQRHFLRIGGRDLLGWADLSETTSQLSDLAGVALQVGLEHLAGHPEWWLPAQEAAAWSRSGTVNQLVVMGLGKLGGGELNYVSDVDLFFLHAPDRLEEADPEGAPIRLNRLCQWLSRLLAEAAEGDRVFHVDHRLRPHGKDGVLISSFNAATEYYLQYGRPWERQMLLKARPVAGNRSVGMAFIQEVRPFVFRRFLDFQALDELRAMRDRILDEAVRPRPDWESFDVKLGIGGIREVEFLVQSLQLIFGGRHPELDEPNTVRCLERLAELKLLDPSAMEELRDAYTFLRRVEHWVQLDQNRQTQKLPKSPEAKRRLSLALGFGGEEGPFQKRLTGCCHVIHSHFAALFGSEPNRSASAQQRDQRYAPEGPPEAAAAFPPDLVHRLRRSLHFASPALMESVLGVLQEYAEGCEGELQEKIVVRLERYFHQTARRPGLVKLFEGTKPWRQDFLRGLVKSELVADLLCHHPALVEGIATVSGICPPFGEWSETSARLLARTSDYEESLEWIRRLKNERFLQLILADLRGDCDEETLERELSLLADFAIRHTFERVATSLNLPGDLPLSVLAMGKLGSEEMGCLSDLDLVFVYHPPSGGRGDQIPHEVIRFIQRFMNMLSIPLHEGPGYAVDTRLRPTGNYGPLVVTRDSWRDYYQNQADLWEIQALLRIRRVAGAEELGEWIESHAREICYQPREGSEVWNRLCHLRQRMQRERSQEREDQIDIKLGMGGLADLEFLVQGIQLVDGHADPSLQQRSVRRVLTAILARTEKLQPYAHDAGTGFTILRSLEHRLRLHTNLASSRLTPQLFDSLRQLHLWPPNGYGRSLESWADVLNLRRRVRTALNLYCPGLQAPP